MRQWTWLLLLMPALVAPPAMAAPTLTLRLATPTYLGGSVGRLFPDGPRLGGAAELGMPGGWSLSLEGTYLRKDWGSAAYGLAITPLMLRQEVPLGSEELTWVPFLNWGAGAAAMTLFGGAPAFQMGMGPTAAAGFGFRIAKRYSLRMEAQGGLIQDVRYFGLALSLGLSQPLATQTLGTPSFEKPPFPEGAFTKVGEVFAQDGDSVQLSLDELPYRVRPGDTLVIYYRAGVPIKIAKLRITHVSANGRTAQGRVMASTESIRRGYYVGTL